MNVFLQLFENLGNFNKKEMNLKNFEGNLKENIFLQLLICNSCKNK